MVCGNCGKDLVLVSNKYASFGFVCLPCEKELIEKGLNCDTIADLENKIYVRHEYFKALDASQRK